MQFNSAVFIFLFLPITIGLYYFVFKKTSLRNCFLLIASFAFYSWQEPYYVFLLLFVILAAYHFALKIDLLKVGDKKKAKQITVIAVLINVCLLVVFKYSGFIISNLNRIINLPLSAPKFSFPLGLSFYLFQSLSYLIDVYQGKCEAQKNFVDVGLLIAFFPKLLSGPLVRFSEEQSAIKGEGKDDFSSGLKRFIIGLAKKMLVADQFSLIANEAFKITDFGQLSIAFAWLGAIAFTLQIYYDFSGYSDMAIGIGLIFGFSFPENFNYPYIAKSMTDFWRRWHISLSRWFRDYIYIPLGGSRCSAGKHVRNLLIIWLLTGLWHGAGWNFIGWGLLHFLLLFIEKYIFRPERLKKPLAKYIYQIFVLIAIVGTFAVFRGVGVKNTIQYGLAMFGLTNNALVDNTAVMYAAENKILFAIACLGSAPIIPWITKKLHQHEALPACAFFKIFQWIIVGILFIFCVAKLMRTAYSPFIYFGF